MTTTTHTKESYEALVWKGFHKQATELATEHGFDSLEEAFVAYYRRLPTPGWERSAMMSALIPWLAKSLQAMNDPRLQAIAIERT